MIPPLFVTQIAIPAAYASSRTTPTPTPSPTQPTTACVLFPESLDSPFPLPFEQFLVSWCNALDLMKGRGKSNPMELVLHESLRCYCAMVETDLLGEIVPMVRVWMPICRPENKDLLARMLWSSTVFSFINHQSASTVQDDSATSPSLAPQQHQPSVLTLPKTPRRPGATSHSQAAPIKPPAAPPRPPTLGPRQPMAAGSHAVKSFAPLAEKPTGTTGAKRVAQDGQTETESKEKEMADHQNAQKRARVDDYSTAQWHNQPTDTGRWLTNGTTNHRVTFVTQPQLIHASTDGSAHGQSSTFFQAPSADDAAFLATPTAFARARSRSRSVDVASMTTYPADDRRPDVRNAGMAVYAHGNGMQAEGGGGYGPVRPTGLASGTNGNFARQGVAGMAPADERRRLNHREDWNQRREEEDDMDPDNGSGKRGHEQGRIGGTLGATSGSGGLEDRRGLGYRARLASNPNHLHASNAGLPQTDRMRFRSDANANQQRRSVTPLVSVEDGRRDVDDADNMDTGADDDREVDFGGGLDGGYDGHDGPDGYESDGDGMDGQDDANMEGDRVLESDTQDKRRLAGNGTRSRVGNGGGSENRVPARPRGRNQGRQQSRTHGRQGVPDDISRPVPTRALRSRTNTARDSIGSASTNRGNGGNNRATRETTAQRRTRQQSAAASDNGSALDGAEDEDEDDDDEDTDGHPRGIRYYTQPHAKKCTNCIKSRIECKTKQRKGSSICAACSAGKKRNCTFRTSSIAEKTEIINRNLAYPREALDNLLDDFAYLVKRYKTPQEHEVLDEAAEEYACEVREVIHRLATYQDEFFEHMAPELTAGKKSLDIDLEEPILERYDLG